MSHMWTTEILDVRMASKPTLKAEREADTWRAILRGGDGKPCEPACGFACCVSCVASPLARRVCQVTAEARAKALARVPQNRRGVCHDANDTCARA